jgi:2-iminobutanoate/2-iminopropanoate deaminase
MDPSPYQQIHLEIHLGILSPALRQSTCGSVATELGKPLWSRRSRPSQRSATSRAKSGQALVLCKLRLPPLLSALTAQGVTALGPFLFTAGQVGLDPKTGKLVGEDIVSQTRQALLNVQAVLEAGGTTLSQVVKTTVFLADMEDFAAMNEVYREFFATDPAPARSCVQVARLPLNARVEIEVVACYPQST